MMNKGKPASPRQIGYLNSFRRDPHMGFFKKLDGLGIKPSREETGRIISLLIDIDAFMLDCSRYAISAGQIEHTCRHFNEREEAIIRSLAGNRREAQS